MNLAHQVPPESLATVESLESKRRIALPRTTTQGVPPQIYDVVALKRYLVDTAEHDQPRLIPHSVLLGTPIHMTADDVHAIEGRFDSYKHKVKAEYRHFRNAFNASTVPEPYYEVDTTLRYKLSADPKRLREQYKTWYSEWKKGAKK